MGVDLKGDTKRYCLQKILTHCSKQQRIVFSQNFGDTGVVVVGDDLRGVEVAGVGGYKLFDGVCFQPVGSQRGHVLLKLIDGCGS